MGSSRENAAGFGFARLGCHYQRLCLSRICECLQNWSSDGVLFGFKSCSRMLTEAVPWFGVLLISVDGYTTAAFLSVVGLQQFCTRLMHYSLLLFFREPVAK